ncbi:uroporphyrin-III C-methyltransferase [Herbaspirillum sp. Sphag1AN]|uniref:uroporphyrinogen-III C-methyltransferase n=1 Tax=unclassified Herbaspirillum TaxID=2624150 RepID=UPI001622A990|nr:MULTISPECIES: uroporphyrinogen-III C-methyltransferase [unclassified Herbaspirillum]MBB3213345.1 uroporphyrin-III C-methyltransferase [Herbaspirillum sp. Sphag1AN]MBB3246611.1 uroporphyrin-III C-methyltransferase [Herbaspirillum sp. Sphag64]
MSQPTSPNPVSSTILAVGKVYLIGAGPGAADLITVRGARLLAQADAVLYDALVTEDMLALCPQAVKIAVGKRSGQRSTAQPVINQRLVESAQQYRMVVRLKGGDPMLFGRADEELRALDAANITYEIVPGITAALAAASSAQRPLTKRGIARSVSLFTSSTAPDEPEEFIMPNGDTLVQYMGGREATATAQRLLSLGYPRTTPVVVVENCSREDEHILDLQLGTLEQGLAACSGPVLVMIGEALAPRPVTSNENQK